MGYNSRADNVALLLSALSIALAKQGYVAGKAKL